MSAQTSQTQIRTITNGKELSDFLSKFGIRHKITQRGDVLIKVKRIYGWRGFYRASDRVGYCMLTFELPNRKYLSISDFNHFVIFDKNKIKIAEVISDSTISYGEFWGGQILISFHND